MEEEEDMLRQRFSEDELERLRPSFTADATNDETFHDSAPADDWEQRHEEMARLLEQEHQKFASKGGDLMDDVDDDDGDDDLEDEDGLGAHAVRGAHQPPPEGSFFGFNTSLEHLRGSNLDDLEEEEVLSRVSRMGLGPANGSKRGVADSLNDETFGDDGLEGSETAWEGLGKDDDVGDEVGASQQQSARQGGFGGPDPKRVSGIMSLEEIEASLARANPAAGKSVAPPMGGGGGMPPGAAGGRPPMPGLDPRFGPMPPGMIPPQGMPMNFFPAGMGRPGGPIMPGMPMPPPGRQGVAGPGGAPPAWLPLNHPPAQLQQQHPGSPMKQHPQSGGGYSHNAAASPARFVQQQGLQPQYGSPQASNNGSGGYGDRSSSPFRTQSQYDEQPRYFTKQRWTEQKERMSAYDINTIIRLHSSHLPMPLPFNEDYYYQSYLAARQQGKRPVTPHTPLCETQPLPVKRHTDATDPFKGALGRIPNHSVRSPRPLLQLEGFLDQKALARRNRDESRAAAQQQQPPYEAPSSEAAWTNHAVLLRIEQAFGFILDLEDIDLLITNSAIEPQAGMNLLNKRRDIAATLFSLLGINTQPPMAPRNLPAFDYDEEREPTYSLPEDELLVKLAQVPKGCRMLARVIPLLSQAQVVYIVYAFIRNLHYILTAPKTKDEMMMSSRLSFALSQAISGLQLAPLTVCLHMFISYAQIEAFKTKSGLLILRSIFTRAYQLASQVRSVPPQHGTEMAELSMWEDTFAGFMEAMSGYFCALLRLAADEDDQLASPLAPPEGSIFVGLMHVWDFLLLLTLHTSPAQKESVFAEVREPLEESLVNPARAQHKPAIFAFLQRLQKEHHYASFFHGPPPAGHPVAGPTSMPPPGMAFGMAPPPSALPSFAGLSAAQ